MTPRWTGSRRPHSRQYSWSGSYGVPQRGHSPPSASGAGGGPAARQAARAGAPTSSPRDRLSCSGLLVHRLRVVLAVAVVASRRARRVPQFAQNCASAGRAFPQLVHETTGSSPTGRPQFAQKCEPHWIGAPQVQRCPTPSRRCATETSSSSSISRRRPSTRDHLLALLDQQVLLELVAPEHLEHQSAEVADALLARPDEGAPFAPERARRRNTLGSGRSRGPPSGAASAGRLRNLSSRAIRAIGRREFTGPAEKPRPASKVDDDDALLGQLAHRVRRSLARVARILDAAVGHLVGAERRRLVDGHAAELEARGPPAARRECPR